jgi:hypothetical protein
MKRSNTETLTDPDDLATYKQMVAYHEAGHAVAICLNNKLKNLPPVFFKIVFTNIMSGR